MSPTSCQLLHPALYKLVIHLIHYVLVQSHITNLFARYTYKDLEFVANDLPSICFTNWVRAILVPRTGIEPVRL